MSRWARPDVPHPPDHREPLVDHVLVDLGLADLDRVVEEVHRDQVLALGGDLDDAERRRRREPVLAEHAQGVVLVLHEPADRRERRLVLELPVEHRAAELVPPVGAHVAPRVELREDRPSAAVLVDHGELQRGRTAGRLQTDRLDVLHREPELVLQRGADRLAATPGDVEVRRLAARTVGDREEVVGGEGTERGQRDRDPDDRAEHDVGEVVDAEVDPQRADDRDRARRGDLRPEPRPAGNDEHERHADRQDRHRADRDRRRRVALPARQLPHAERPRSQREELEPLQERSDDAEGDDPDHELAPAAEPRRSPARRAHRAPRTRRASRRCAPGARSVSSHPARALMTASVIRASNRSNAPGSTRIHQQPVTTTATSRISQIQPVEPICLGSGGAAPVGRRRRWTTTPASADAPTTWSC